MHKPTTGSTTQRLAPSNVLPPGLAWSGTQLQGCTSMHKTCLHSADFARHAAYTEQFKSILGQSTPWGIFTHPTQAPTLPTSPIPIIPPLDSQFPCAPGQKPAANACFGEPLLQQSSFSITQSIEGQLLQRWLTARCSVPVPDHAVQWLCRGGLLTHAMVI